MFSKTEICNRALQCLNKPSTSNIETDASQVAKRVNEAYNFALKYILGEGNYGWSFATKNEALALLEDESHHYEYVYAKPAGCLKVNYVFIPECYYSYYNYINFKHSYHNITYIEEDEKILTNQKDAYVNYITAEPDTTQFTPDLVEAIAWRIAYQLATPLNQDKGLENTARIEFERHLKKAKVSDANKGNHNNNYKYNYGNRIYPI
jgi:hypothetical protein